MKGWIANDRADISKGLKSVIIWRKLYEESAVSKIGIYK